MITKHIHYNMSELIFLKARKLKIHSLGTYLTYHQWNNNVVKNILVNNANDLSAFIKMSEWVNEWVNILEK